VHFSLKIWKLHGGNNFNDFADSQLAKCRAVFHPDGCCKQLAGVITMRVGLSE